MTDDRPAFPKPIRHQDARKRKKRPKTRAKRRKATKALCDRLWADSVKSSGECYFKGYLPEGSTERHICKGSLQAMHKISRRYHSTRWNLQNGVPGCQSIHLLFTKRPELWERWLRCHWGAELYEAMWAIALKPWDKNQDAVLEKLQAELK